jgi:hypothetical protein
LILAAVGFCKKIPEDSTREAFITVFVAYLLAI